MKGLTTIFLITAFVLVELGTPALALTDCLPDKIEYIDLIDFVSGDEEEQEERSGEDAKDDIFPGDAVRDVIYSNALNRTAPAWQYDFLCYHPDIPTPPPDAR